MKPIEYLSPYLPYELRILWDKEILIMDLEGDGTRNMSIVDVIGYGYKPILRPMSDLTKEIDHNGERFVPEKVLLKVSGGELGSFTLKEFKEGVKAGLLPFDMMMILIGWHFDVFNLHEKGLCVYYDEINP